MAYPWFKFFGGDYLHDEKLLGMDGNARSCWLTLLCYASTSEKQGTVRFLTEDLLMVQAGVPMGGEEWERTKGVLNRFEERGMVEVKEGVIEILNWDKRQAQNATPAQRAALHRRNARNKKVTLEEEVDKEEEIHTLFDRMWEVYPKKVGKREAFKAFEKLNPTEQLTSNIISAIESLKLTPQWQDNDGRYIPHPSTFLNRESFDDAPAKKGPKIVEWEVTPRGARPIYEKHDA